MKTIHYILIVISWIAFVVFGYIVGVDLTERRSTPADPLALCQGCEPCPINFEVLAMECKELDSMLLNCERAYMETYDKLQLYQEKEKLEADVKAKQIELKIKDL